MLREPTIHFCLEFGAKAVEEYGFASLYADQDFINLLNFKHPEKVSFLVFSSEATL